MEPFKDVMNQLTRFWDQLKFQQKLIFSGSLFAVLIFLSLILFTPDESDFVALYPKDQVSATDVEEIQAFLQISGISYDVKDDRLIFVPRDSVHRIRMELAGLGLPKKQEYDSYKLFDSNTWIRGEKELQVLELRALKGQLQQDISQYENIREVSVMIDLQPARPFGGGLQKTTASVLVKLQPGSRLSEDQVQSITHHLAGAVRGLKPNMIAISDTSGKLYQAIDARGPTDQIQKKEVSLEEHIQAKIDGMLSKIVGLDNYYTTVQVLMSRERISEELSFSPQAPSQTKEEEQPVSQIANQIGIRYPFDKGNTFSVDKMEATLEPGRVKSISISILIDKSIAVNKGSQIPEEELQNGIRNTEALKGEIERQISTVLAGYQAKVTQSVDFVEFDKAPYEYLDIAVEQPLQKSWFETHQTALYSAAASFLFLLIGFMLFLFSARRFSSPPSGGEPSDDPLNRIEHAVRTNPSEAAKRFKTWFDQRQSGEINL